MRRYLPLTIGIAAALLADPVLALDLKPLEASSVKAALDCVAAAALNDLPANSRLFFDATPFGPFTKCGSDYVAATALNDLPIYRANSRLFFDTTSFGPFTKFSLGVARTEEQDEGRRGRLH